MEDHKAGSLLLIVINKQNNKIKIYFNIYTFCFILLFTSSLPCRKDQFPVSYNRFNCTDTGLQLGDPASLIGLMLWTC